MRETSLLASSMMYPKGTVQKKKRCNKKESIPKNIEKNWNRIIIKDHKFTMKLHYVSIGLSDDYCIDKEYRKTFEYHTRFISNYLSRKIRKYKYETDGTYNMIYICLGCVRQPCIDNNSLVIHLPFDKEKYETARQLEDFEYYLTFFEEGFKEATELKNIPKQILFQMLDNFRTDRYKNEWVYKKKKGSSDISSDAAIM